MRMGEYNELSIIRETENGLYLGDGEFEVLLPRGQMPRKFALGDQLRVFIYTDSEDRPIATTKPPRATVGEFAFLKVVGLSGGGAFFDWGIDKDLFCPLREQTTELNEGQSYLVRVYLDVISNRVVCSMNIPKYLRTSGEDLQLGQPVRIMVYNVGRDAISVIVNNYVRGTIFPDEWHEELHVGEMRDAYVKAIRAGDNKVAISLRPQGYQAVIGERDRILQALERQGGFLPISDRSSPEEIHFQFGLSKGAFKKIIGALYREGIITIESHGIRLV